MTTTTDKRYIYTDANGTEWLVDPATDTDTRLKDLDPDHAEELRQTFGEPIRTDIFDAPREDDDGYLAR